MKVVKVYGALRKRLGQCRFEFEAATPAQALKALCVNFPGLDKWLIDSEKDGVSYRVTIGKERVIDDLSPLVMPWSEKEVFSITPIIAGAGRGFGAIAAGIGLITLAIHCPWRMVLRLQLVGFSAVRCRGNSIEFCSRLCIWLPSLAMYCR